MAEKLPTQSGRKVLLNLAKGRPADFGLYGRSSYAHLPGTIWSLRRTGLLDHQNKLTEAGQQMVNRLTVTPEVTHV